MEIDILQASGMSCIKPVARLFGQIKRVILLPNISMRRNSPSSGAAKS